MNHRPVITGLGIVSPIGVGTGQFWKAACAGQSGIGPLMRFDGTKLPRECQIVGEVRDFNPRDWMLGRAGETAGRFSQFAVASAKMAVVESCLDMAEISPHRIKVAIGTSMDGLVDIHHPNHVAFLRGDEILPWTVLEYPAHAATSHVAIAVGARGETFSVATACAAGLDAIAWAAEQVQRGEATAVIAGGTETPLSEYSLKAFHAVGVLSKWAGPPAQASRPFDKLRSGLVLAEGAATVIVEDETHARARGASIYAQVLGFASITEGTHLRKVDDSGESDAHVMASALGRAKLAPRDIDYICAHGNSMVDYDIAETSGIKQAFGRHAWSIPVSSPKSMCGQALAASGAIQVVTACLALRDGVVPPTINYQVPDPACDLDYVPNFARRVRVRAVLIHAHSMGGSHTVMILGAPN